MNASLIYTLKTIQSETFEREFLFGLQSELFGTGYRLRFNMIFVITENHLFKCFVSSVVDGVNSVTRLPGVIKTIRHCYKQALVSLYYLDIMD